MDQKKTYSDERNKMARDDSVSPLLSERDDISTSPQINDDQIDVNTNSRIDKLHWIEIFIAFIIILANLVMIIVDLIDHSCYTLIEIISPTIKHFCCVALVMMTLILHNFLEKKKPSSIVVKPHYIFITIMIWFFYYIADVYFNYQCNSLLHYMFFFILTIRNLGYVYGICFMMALIKMIDVKKEDKCTIHALVGFMSLLMYITGFADILCLKFVQGNLQWFNQTWSYYIVLSGFTISMSYWNYPSWSIMHFLTSLSILVFNTILIIL